MITRRLIEAPDGRGWIFLGILAAVAILVPCLNLLLPPSSPLHVPTSAVALWGKYLCYALLALSLDLVWGYCGILSLGHGAFFGVGVYTTAALAGNHEWPFLWTLPIAALAAAILGAGLGAVVFRVRALRGELFALLTLAITFVLSTIALNTVDGGPGIQVMVDVPKVTPTASGFLYLLMLGAAALTLWVAYSIAHSRFGTGLFNAQCHVIQHGSDSRIVRKMTASIVCITR